MKAQNDVGVNTKEFVNWMNDKSKNLVDEMGLIVLQGVKEGFEASAITNYLYSEVMLAHMGTVQRLNSLVNRSDITLNDVPSDSYAEFKKFYTDTMTSSK